jgi:uncharacterized alpha-E superfamily protein
VRQERVVEFLLLDPEFPRSIRFSATRIEGALRAVARHGGRSGGRAERLSGRLRASLDYAQVDEILSDGARDHLRDISTQCAEIHDAVYQSYIAYSIDSALRA